MESDLGQYSSSCLRVGLIMSSYRFMSSCGIDHVFVSVSCLRVFHVFVSVSYLRVVSCLRVGFMSSRGFRSSCCFHNFASFSYLRVVFRSSRHSRIQRTAAFSRQFFPLYLANDHLTEAA